MTWCAYSLAQAEMEPELVLDFKFNGKWLAPEGQETEPAILWWSTAVNGWSTWTKIEWEDDSKVMSKTQRVRIPLGSSTVRTDDTVRMECVVLSPNQDNRLVRAKA